MNPAMATQQRKVLVRSNCKERTKITSKAQCFDVTDDQYCEYWASQLMYDPNLWLEFVPEDDWRDLCRCYNVDFEYKLCWDLVVVGDFLCSVGFRHE